MEVDQVDLSQVKILKDSKTLALVEVPFVSGKVQLTVQWKSGTFLPLYECRAVDEYSLEHMRTPLLLKLELVEDEDE